MTSSLAPHIIIADDHQVIRTGLRQILIDKYPNANLEEVSNGITLVEKIALCSWDIIICDLHMPDKGGFEVLREIKETHPQLPVILVSVSSDAEYTARALECGAAFYLNKDNIHSELLQAVEKILIGK